MKIAIDLTFNLWLIVLEMNTLGQKIRGIRHRKKLTLAQVALATELSVSAMSQFETGGKTPRLGTVRRIAKALGVRAGSLVDASEKMR